MKLLKKPKNNTLLHFFVFCFHLLFAVQAHCENITRYTPSFTITNILALPNDRLLLWAEDGQIQIRESNGELNPVARLPFEKIIDIKPKGSGILVLGEPKLAFGASPIFALDAKGNAIDHWSVAAVREIYADESGDWAMQFKNEVIELMPGGLLGKSEHIPEWTKQPARPRRLSSLPLQWHRYYWQGITVYCHNADLSKEGSASARCERPGTEGWAYIGSLTLSDPVITCGQWLIMHVGKSAQKLIVLDFKSGKVMGNSEDFKSSPKVCSGDNNLLIGTNRLELVQLPSLKSVWQSPVQPSLIVMLAATERYFAYRLAKGQDIYVWPYGG
jgi:hypothetical protein